MAGRTQDESHPFEDHLHRPEQTERAPRKRRRWPWLFLLLLLILFVLPNVIAMTGLKQQAIDYALSDFEGRVTVQSASMGWFQPITLQNIEAVDSAGQPLASVAEIRTSRSLISFLTSSDYGSVEINQPSVWLQIHSDGSNFEDAIAPWMTTSQSSDDGGAVEATGQNVRLPKIEMNINNGTIAVFTPDETQSWQIERLNVKANTSHELAAVLSEIACHATVYNGPVGGQLTAQNSGTIAATLQIDPSSPVFVGNYVNAAIKTNQLPLSVAEPFLQRLIGPTETDGALTAEIQVACDLASGESQLSIKQADATNIVFKSPQMIGSDELRIANLTAIGNVAASPSLVTADKCQIAGDFASLSANGQLDLNDLAGMSSGETTLDNAGLLNSPFQLSGEIDLAKAAAMFPATMHLHEGLRIESGSVNFQAASRVENEIRRLIVNVDTANLVARDQGKQIVWQKPLRLVGTIRESDEGLLLEEVLCESDFLTVSGTANHETGAFALEGDLARLTQRVNQFVDLGQTAMSGALNGRLAWQTSQPDQVSGSRPLQLVGEFKVDRPRLRLTGLPAWEKPQLLTRVSASGNAMSDQTVQLDQAGVQIDIGTEQVIATLAEPIADIFQQSSWKMNTQLSGSASGWLSSIRNFVDVGDVNLDGNVQARAVTHVSSDSVELQGGEFEVQGLQFEGYGLTVREQQSNGTANARYDLNSGQLLIADATLSSNSISASGQQITIEANEKLLVHGDVAYRADVNRVADWFQLSPSRDSVFWFGDGQGTVRFVSDSEGINALISTTVDQMIAATRSNGSGNSRERFAASQQPGVQPVSSSTQWTELWREAKVNLNSQIKLAHDFETIAFENTSLQSGAVQANLSGRISELSGVMLADIQGNWAPDWQKLNGLVAAWTGKLVQVAGQGSHAISVRGPLFEPSASANSNGQATAWVSPLLSASTEFGWQQAAVAGMPIGAGKMDLDLEQAIANVNTSEISFSGGSMQFQPQIDLRSSEPVLYLPEGKMINQVALTPETARAWLAYVAPLAADATSAKGTFSLTTKGAQVPLMDPLKMKAEGELTLSNVVIGAGPTSEKLIATAMQLRTMLDPEAASKERDLKTWLTLDEQTVPVAIDNGRVYHDGIKISHKDIVVETRGSVGLDQSLDLVAEIPIADKWIEGKNHLAGLKGQKISIPVSGFASSPKLDVSAMNQISTQLIQSAATGAINKLIGDKVAPKVTEYQNQLNNRVSEEANKLQDRIRNGFLEKIAPAQGGQNTDSAKDNIKNELLRGFGNLLGQ